ncbi:hypothetical protein [Actinocrispum sp. NPDC049592]|uniref:EF-hand domain-containing protein n=1 Tax=Actinocrispum sp. NPDC049592 TaxID=3154835 RepID=UPI00343DED7F
MALTELQSRKLDRAFTQVDIDGNGYIEREDVLGLGARLLVNFAEAPTSAKGRFVIDRFSDLWDALVGELDVNGNGRLSPEEYAEGMRAAFIEGPHFAEVFLPAAESIVELCDTDGDGTIEFAEFQAMQEAFGTATEDAEAAFVRLDRDVSGSISTDELSEAVRAYFTGDDPGAPGNWLFGPLPGR